MKKTLGLLCCLAACAAIARTPEEMKEDVNVITNRILAYVHGNIKLEAMRNFAKLHKLTKEELTQEILLAIDAMKGNPQMASRRRFGIDTLGEVGTTSDGEQIRRYAASLKEGNKNTNTGIYVHLALVIIWAMLGWFVSNGSGWITTLFAFIGIFGAWRMLRPSKDNSQVVSQLLDSFENAK